jgi:hypothetical protein
MVTNDAPAPLERGSTLVVVRHVPAELCDRCGAPLYGGAVVEQLLAMLEDAVRAGVTMQCGNLCRPPRVMSERIMTSPDRPLAIQTAAPPVVPPKRPIVGVAMVDDDDLSRLQAQAQPLAATTATRSSLRISPKGEPVPPLSWW